MAKKQTTGAIEWVGGIVQMPGLGDEDEPFRPEGLFWIGAGGAVLASAMGQPGEAIARVPESLADALARPISGRREVPTRVRVASPELAARVRAARPELEVVVGPTPEIDDLAAALARELEDDDVGPSYLSEGVDPAAVAAFFAAAASLYRAKPWKVLPDAEEVLSVACAQLRVEGGVVSVMGGEGQTPGVLFFRSWDDFVAYLEAGEVQRAEASGDIPDHLALAFERSADLADELREEIGAHRWEVAGPAAYPGALAVEAMEVRPPRAPELRLLEALARALTAVAADKKALATALAGGPAYARTLEVDTHGGRVTLALRLPHERDEALVEGLLAEGRAAGFDVDTAAGLAAWTAKLEAKGARRQSAAAAKASATERRATEAKPKKAAAKKAAAKKAAGTKKKRGAAKAAAKGGARR